MRNSMETQKFSYQSKISKQPGNTSNCYFVGKVELLSWLREFLNIPIKQVEECASGVHYLMLLDALYPG